MIRCASLVSCAETEMTEQVQGVPYLDLIDTIHISSVGDAESISFSRYKQARTALNIPLPSPLLIFNMYFFTVVAFAALPFLAGAVPVSQNSSLAEGPRSFSLTKHSNHLNRHGFVDPRKLRAAAHQTEALVFPPPFL